jgi:cysteine desulfurase
LLSLSFPSYDGEAILHRMDLMGICISTGSACDSKRTVISHVLQAIKMDEKIARGTIRISLGPENTLEEADAIAAGLRRIITGKMQQ